MRSARVAAVVDREVRTVARSRALWVLGLGFALVVVGLAWAGGPAGFVPVVLTLLTPLEVLVPALALAVGYRAVLGDAQRGELDVLRTYPLARRELVLGVFLGRGAALLVAVVGPLLVAGALAAVLGGAKSTVFATHGGADSVWLYLRFVVLTGGFALVALSVALVVSTAARSLRGAIALGAAAAVVLVVGLDLGVVAGLAGGVVPEGALPWLLSLSPNSAYRGLVLQTVVGAVGPTGVETAPLLANGFGLALWLVGALTLAGVTVWPGD